MKPSSSIRFRIITLTVSIVSFSMMIFLSCQGDNPKEASSEKESLTPSAHSLGGEPLYPLKESDQTVGKKDSLLRVAISNFKSNPSLENYIWYGRRQAYLYKYVEAINTYTKALEVFPDSPELYRHRGHRYISVRQFDKAIQDFQVAAELAKDRDIEIEPDGQPNKLDIPLSNLHFNIYYHWALAHFLKGEFEQAANLWKTCLGYSVNDDLLIATTDWYYMTLRRLNKDEEASALLNRISGDMEIIENTSYLRRLLMYKGEIAPAELLDLENTAEDAQLDIVTQGYGVGNWYLYQGDLEKAYDIFNRIVDCDYWPAFGYIAAEAELFRQARD